MKAAVAFLLAASAAFAQIRTVARPSQSPLVTFRIVFTTGAAADPPGKPGLAYLTARMLADGGTRDLTYMQIVDALFPMAASVGAQVDQEMTTFSGSTHIDNLAAYYGILRSMLLEPGWRDDDFQRVKDDAINFLRVNLRGNNDEELGKEVLYQTIYAGTPYGHYSAGTVSSLEKLTLADLKEFYRTRYTQANLILGIAGGYPPRFLAEMKKDFGKLPARGAASPKTPAPEPTDRNRVVIVDKETRSVAYSIGFPIDVTRASPDYVPLLVASSYLTPHSSWSSTRRTSPRKGPLIGRSTKLWKYWSRIRRRSICHSCSKIQGSGSLLNCACQAWRRICAIWAVVHPWRQTPMAPA